MKRPSLFPVPATAASPTHPDRRRFLLTTSAVGMGCMLAPWASAYRGLTDPMGVPLSNASLSASNATINTLRALLISSLAKTSPLIGGYLVSLGNLFVPMAGEDPEALWQRYTDEKISETVTNLVKADLAGISDVARLYRDAVRDGNPDTIKTQSIAARTVFAQRMPQFQLTGHEGSLLHYFAMAATLELALLRDMALTGKQIGLSDADVESVKDDLTARISRYERYVDEIVPKVVDNARRDNPYSNTPYGRNQPLSAIHEALYALTPSVIDVRATWNAFDARKFPNGSRIRLERELLSPVVGWWHPDTSPPKARPDWSTPKSDVRSIEFWIAKPYNAEYMSGFKVNHSDGSSVMTGQASGRKLELDLNQRYVTSIAAFSTAAIGGMTFLTQPDKEISTLGPPKDKVARTLYAHAPRGHRLSSLRSIGTAKDHAVGGVSGFVAGFQLIDKDADAMARGIIQQLPPDLPHQVARWLAT